MQELGSTVLFRLACDARSGNFVGTFCRSAKLLRLLASNEPTASETMALRTAKMAQNRRRAASANSSGRLVRDAFDGLTRSMDVLGTRTGVGGSWLDKDGMSESLRHRAVQLACKDAKNSLVTCCGMAVVYGLGALAMGAATGITAQPDLCGGPIETIDGKTFVNVPPAGFVLDQHLVHQQYITSTGERKKKAFLERTAFAMTCSIDESTLEIHGINLSVTVESPSSSESSTLCERKISGCHLLTSSAQSQTGNEFHWCRSSLLV